MADAKQKAGPARFDGSGPKGPDPVWGAGVFIVGLLVMGVGGAKTWHWTFNVGQGLLMIGSVWFLLAVALTSVRQQPLNLRARLPMWLGGTGGDDDDEAS